MLIKFKDIDEYYSTTCKTCQHLKIYDDTKFNWCRILNKYILWDGFCCDFHDRKRSGAFRRKIKKLRRCNGKNKK